MGGFDYDLCVIGGGINGAGVARDAAGRGLKVLLLEAHDLAAATSSSSTKLIHGGLRYLEYYDFKLVREALKEREVLLRLAPHIIWPMRFVLPHDAGQRPKWMIRAGLFLYDHLAKRNILPSSRYVDVKNDAYGKALAAHYTDAFCYSDCWVEDARLVVLNAMAARDKGATILPQHKCTGITPYDIGYEVEYCGAGVSQTVRVKAVVNAAGPWVGSLLEESDLAHDKHLPQIKLVKGSHIIVPRQYDGQQAYIVQQKDSRIVFAIPYEREFTLIGTTEEAMEGDPLRAEISRDETQYLITAYNEAFASQISESDIVWSYSGVRPLFDDGQDNDTATTRDYKIFKHKFAAPFLSIFGGKLTTYRTLSQDVVNKLCRMMEVDAPEWTADEPLPGGDIPHANFEGYVADMYDRYPDLPECLLRRYARAYGTRIHDILEGGLGVHYGDDVYEAELKYVLQHEFCTTPDDFLWRRTKLGLHISESTKQVIEKAWNSL